MNDRIINYLNKMSISIQGHGGSKALFKVAMVLVERFACSSSEALEYMYWFNRTSCHPKWTDKELKHKIDDAFKRINPANLGCLNKRGFNK